MHLVQRLTIGLVLACMMMLASCSKEDGQSPVPQVEINNGSQMRVVDGFEVLPQFPPTSGQTGVDILPSKWARYISNNPSDASILPIGTSTLAHLWGNASFPWEEPLLASPAIQNTASIVTVTTHTTNGLNSEQAIAKTRIRYLKPGKKYAITFYVATTKLSGVMSHFTQGYAKAAEISIASSWAFGGSEVAYNVDLANSQATWVPKTIIFKPYGTTEAEFYFSAMAAKEGEFAYAHIFVDKNSIKEVN